MSIIFNKGQRNVINAAVDWYHNSSRQIFKYAGNPGTGKSVVLNQIIQELGIPLSRVAPMSFIGAAAIVMRIKGLYNARTMHSWLFNPISSVLYDNNHKPVYNEYYNRPTSNIEFTPKPLGDIDLIVVDEAWSMPYYLKDELESRGKKILITGDIDQLPPVGDKPAYVYDEDTMILDEIMRQAENSAIVYLSQRAKMGLPIHEGFYGDVLVINEDQLTKEMILGSDIILCGKNDTRDYFNKLIRQDYLGIHYDIPTYGEKVICRKNNWRIEVDGISLANGLIGKVANFPDVGSFDGKNFNIDFLPDLCTKPFMNISCDYTYFIAPHEQKKILKNNRYANGEKFEFAYASTVHLAQGSQYLNGIYIEEYLNKDINNKLNYTGLTRFANSCIYVKKKPKYYY